MQYSSFAFLKGTNDILFALASAAERNYPGDPNTTLIKLRMFGEACAHDIATRLNLEIPDKQVDLIRSLAQLRLDSTVIQALHQLRKHGNEAVHAMHDDLNDAEMMLRIGWKVAVWYYRFATRNPDFSPQPFRLPENHDDNFWQGQVDSMRAQLQAAERRNSETSEALAEKQHQITALQGQLSVLESQQQETEQQTQARVQAVEEQAAVYRTELASISDTERKQRLAQWQSNSHRKLELSEEETRYIIDRQLREAGWEADSKALHYNKGTLPQPNRNMAIAEWPTADGGKADYVLFIGLEPVAIVEAKKQSIDVRDALNQAADYSIHFDHSHLAARLAIQDSRLAAEQGADYRPGWPTDDSTARYKIPFIYSANGREFQRQLLTKSGIWHRDVRNAQNQANALPQWHTPQELLDKLERNTQQADQQLTSTKPTEMGLRYYQQDAVSAVEQAIVRGQRDILLAMATGTGKTRTAIALMYRLIDAQRFNRILFLVDRRSLGEQALSSFAETRINDQAFGEIFGIDDLSERFPASATRVHVATVQSLVKRTLQSDEFMPVQRYDCIIIDEAHRGYTLDKEQTEGEMVFRNLSDYVSAYRRILDHFDATKIALTATPALHTGEIFGEPVYRYTYRQAVVDGYLNDQEPPITITTQLTADGIHYDAESNVERLSPQGELLADTLKDEQDFEVADFNRSIIVTGFNQAVCQELTNYLNPTGKQKTLIFCVNNEHADMVVELLQKEFRIKYPQLAHDAIQKITGTSEKNAKKLQDRINAYSKEDYSPNIAVTVDLLTTGIDVPSICNLVFLRKVRSRILYEQMKGRATRLCPEVGKTSFRIFDPVQLYKTLQDVDTMRPVVVRPKVDIQTLIDELTDHQSHQITEADGRSFAEHSLEQLCVKLQRVAGQAEHNRLHNPELDNEVKQLDNSIENQLDCSLSQLPAQLRKGGARQAGELLSQMPQLAGRLDQLKQSINNLRDLPIFADLPDKVINVERNYGEYNNAEDFLDAFDRLVKQGTNQHIALDTVVNRPRDLTRTALIELQEWFDRQHFDESTLRVAWHETRNQDIAARLVGHIRRAALGDALIPFEQRVDNALAKLLASNDWTPGQTRWLERLTKTLKESVAIDDNTFRTGNYKRQGGRRALEKAFPEQLDDILARFNEYIWEEPA